MGRNIHRRITDAVISLRPTVNIPPKDLEAEYRTLCRALRDSRMDDAIEAIAYLSEKPKRLEKWKARIIPAIADLEPTHAAKRKGIRVDLQLQVFRQNGFNCVYCGNKTVLIPVLRVIAEHLKDTVNESLFQYDAHGRYDRCHYAFWCDSASCDHIVPVACGGLTEIKNLVTACFMCNLRKGKSAGPERFDGVVRPWDGLAEFYPDLVRKRWGSAIPYHHKPWMTAIERPAPRSD